MEPSGRISPTWRVRSTVARTLEVAVICGWHHQTRSLHGGPAPRQLCRTSLTTQEDYFQGCTSSFYHTRRQAASSINTLRAFSRTSKWDYTSRSAGMNNLHGRSVNNAVSVGEPLGGARCRVISWLGCSKNWAGSECLRAGLWMHVSSSTCKRKCTCDVLLICPGSKQ